MRGSVVGIVRLLFRLSYFIQKGADVNAVGGELRGTPLHWATRLVAILAPVT